MRDRGKRGKSLGDDAGIGSHELSPTFFFASDMELKPLELPSKSLGRLQLPEESIFGDESIFDEESLIDLFDVTGDFRTKQEYDVKSCAHAQAFDIAKVANAAFESARMSSKAAAAKLSELESALVLRHVEIKLDLAEQDDVAKTQLSSLEDEKQMEVGEIVLEFYGIQAQIESEKQVADLEVTAAAAVEAALNDLLGDLNEKLADIPNQKHILQDKAKASALALEAEANEVRERAALAHEDITAIVVRTRDIAAMTAARATYFQQEEDRALAEYVDKEAIRKKAADGETRASDDLEAALSKVKVNTRAAASEKKAATKAAAVLAKAEKAANLKRKPTDAALAAAIQVIDVKKASHAKHFVNLLDAKDKEKVDLLAKVASAKHRLETELRAKKKQEQVNDDGCKELDKELLSIREKTTLIEKHTEAKLKSIIKEHQTKIIELSKSVAIKVKNLRVETAKRKSVYEVAVSNADLRADLLESEAEEADRAAAQAKETSRQKPWRWTRPSALR